MVPAQQTCWLVVSRSWWEQAADYAEGNTGVAVPGQQLQKASLGRRIVEEGTGASSRDRRRVKESILGGCTAVSNWLA